MLLFSELNRIARVPVKFVSALRYHTPLYVLEAQPKCSIPERLCPVKTAFLINSRKYSHSRVSVVVKDMTIQSERM